MTDTTLTFHADAYAGGRRFGPHWHEELQLSLVLSGFLSETVGRVTEWAGALSVVVKDAGVTHADDFGPTGAKLARLTLPAGTLAALIEDPQRSCEWRWSHGAAVSGAYVRLVRRAAGEGRTFKADDPDVLDLLAAITARPAPPGLGTPPAWLVQVIDELRAERPVCRSVTQVARRAGVHPVYLARCVRRWYGTGVADELRRLRMQVAATALAEQCGTLAEVAHSRGFADESHLSREFQRSAGTTPGRYRTLVRSLGYVQDRGR